jgi:hypothetical protein
MQAMDARFAALASEDKHESREQLPDADAWQELFVLNG